MFEKREVNDRDKAWTDYVNTDWSMRYASERHEGFNAGWEAGRRAGAKYPGEPVDLALVLQAIDGAARFPGQADLMLVPSRLIELVRDAVAELSWRRDSDADGRMIK